MKLEVIQYTLKAKDELDMIIGTIENLMGAMIENGLDEIYTNAFKKMIEMQRTAYSSRVALSDTFEEFCFSHILKELKNETE